MVSVMDSKNEMCTQSGLKKEKYKESSLSVDLRE